MSMPWMIRLMHLATFGLLDEDIKVGNSATSKSLQLKVNVLTFKDIYMTEVKNRYCNIRMLPDGFDCLSLCNLYRDRPYQPSV